MTERSIKEFTEYIMPIISRVFPLELPPVKSASAFPAESPPVKNAPMWYRIHRCKRFVWNRHPHSYFAAGLLGSLDVLDRFNSELERRRRKLERRREGYHEYEDAV